MKNFFSIVLGCFVMTKLTSAQVVRTKSSGPLLPEEIFGSNLIAPAPPSLYNRSPKCYPETATAYFLPAPPSAPKVTILDPNWNDVPNHNLNFKEIPASLPSNIIYNQAINEPYSPSLVLPSNHNYNFPEISAGLPPSVIFNRANVEPPPSNHNYNFPEISAGLPPSVIFNRANVEPPHNPSPVLPDLIDNMPLFIQNRFVHLVGPDDRGCETCSRFIEKLPIFNFDKELLDGFLAGLGINT